MARTTLRAKGQLTLPEEIRTAAHLVEGDLLDAEITEDGILLRPQKVIDATRRVGASRRGAHHLAAGRHTRHLQAALTAKTCRNPPPTVIPAPFSLPRHIPSHIGPRTQLA
ncbi:MAG: AbrB/MazE/SpoVT family DNA-binding domain-containing protein [Pseudonocardiaceae bacterium]